MPNVVNSPNMNMPLPVVGVDPGPDYATNINASLTILDGHDHSPGNGVPVTTDGISITADLPLNGFNMTLVRSVRLNSQNTVLTLPSDLRCLYAVGVDLYFNDGNGNNIQITQSGGIAGTPGSISNLTPPASASYVAADSTFVWQSDASIAANMDFGAAIMRNITPNSTFALTLQPPSALGSNYSITLPSLPASQKIMTLDNTGAMSAPYSVDGSTIVISSNVIKVPTNGITSLELADNSVDTAAIQNSAVTSAKMAVFPNLSSTVVTSTSNITTAAHATEAILLGVGGGGGAGSGVNGNSSRAGGGGGAGGSIATYPVVVIPSTQYSVAIGPGGAGGGAGLQVDGSNGGATEFNRSTTVTITIASPAVISISTGTADFRQFAPVSFNTSGALPTGIVAGTEYYVTSKTGGTFKISTVPNGADINTSGAQSGTHTATIVIARFKGGGGGASVGSTAGAARTPSQSAGGAGSNPNGQGAGSGVNDWSEASSGGLGNVGGTSGGGGGGGPGLSKGGNGGASGAAATNGSNGISGLVNTGGGGGGGGGGGVGGGALGGAGGNGGSGVLTIIQPEYVS